MWDKVSAFQNLTVIHKLSLTEQSPYMSQHLHSSFHSQLSEESRFMSDVSDMKTQNKTTALTRTICGI